MMRDDNDGQMIFGDLVGLKLPDIRLTGEEKTSPRKLVPTGDRTWARCVTSAHVKVIRNLHNVNHKKRFLFVFICYDYYKLQKSSGQFRPNLMLHNF